MFLRLGTPLVLTMRPEKRRINFRPLFVRRSLNRKLLLPLTFWRRTVMLLIIVLPVVRVMVIRRRILLLFLVMILFGVRRTRRQLKWFQ